MKRLAVAMLALALAIAGCGSDGPTTPENRNPTITSGPSATPVTILDSVPSQLSVVASDADGDALTYTWSAQVGSITGSGASVTYVPPTVTTQTVHNVDVKISDGRGGSVIGSVNITVSPTPAENTAPHIHPLTATPSSILDSQSSQVAVFATDADEDPLTYAWSAATGGSIAGSGANVTYIPPTVTAQAVHRVDVAVSDGRGGLATGSINIIVNPTPAVNRPPQLAAGPTATPSTIFDSATSQISVTAIDADNDPLTYTWSATGGSITGTGSSVTYDPVTVTAQTVHRVDVAISDGRGSPVTGFVNVTVNPTPPDNTPPQITSGPTATPATILVGQTTSIAVMAMDTDGDPLTYSWTIDGGPATVCPCPSVTFTPTSPVSETTLIRAEVMVTDGRGGSATGFVNVIVNPTPNNPPQITSGPTATPSMILDSETSTVTVTATDPDGDALTYSWTATGGSITGNTTTATVTFDPSMVTSSTNQTVEVTVSDGRGGSVTRSVIVTVNPTPAGNSAPQIVGGPTAMPSTIQVGHTTDISVVASDVDGDPLTYSWRVNNGSPTVCPCPNVSYTPTAPVSGPTIVRIDVTVTDGRGGLASAFVNITVNPAPPTNSPPRITSGPFAAPSMIFYEETSQLSVTATDPDGDPLRYKWTALGVEFDCNTIPPGTGNCPIVNFRPEEITGPSASTRVIRVTVEVTDGRGGIATGFVDVTVKPTPVLLNNGELTEWTARLTTTGNAVYDPLVVVFQQSGTALSGSNRDNDNEVDVSTTGTVDGGAVSITCTTTNGGSPRATIVFNGTVSGTGVNQTINGTYTATGPSVIAGTESGTFSMTHN